jgi:hypothetical protein
MNSDPSVIQAVASRYTDWAIPAHEYNVVSAETSYLEIYVFILLFCYCLLGIWSRL